MGDVLRIGVVGCGRILDAHLNGLKSLWDHGYRDFRVVALCARRAEDAHRYRMRGEGPEPRPPIEGLIADAMVAPHLYVTDIHDDTAPEVYEDWRTMLADARLDALLILTPVMLHHEIALEALAAGLHVLVEKPIAISVRTARRMCEAAERADRRLAVAEVARFGDVVRMSRWCVEHAAIGTPQLAIELMHGMFWSPDRVRADTPWRHDKQRAGGGLAIDRGVHLLHLLEYYCGPLESISAQSAILEPRRRLETTGEMVDCDVDDTFTANLRFASGALGQLGASAALRGWKTRIPLTVHGTTGSLRQGWITWDGGGQAAQQYYRLNVTDAEDRALFGLGVQSDFGLQAWCFMESIRSGVPSEIEGPVGLRDVALAYTVLESAAAGGPRLPVEVVLSGEVAAYQEALDQSLEVR